MFVLLPNYLYCVFAYLMEKRYFRLLIFCLSVSVLASCVKDKDDEERSPYCAITAFSVGSIITYVTTTDAAGNNIVTRRVVSGNDIPFSIDQQASTITSVNALPNWISLNKVVPVFTSYGNVYLVIDGAYYGITSGTDSIDVSEPRTLACISTDGGYEKKYTLAINKKVDASDMIAWERLSVADLQLEGSHRALMLSAMYQDVNGADSLVRRMFVFSNNAVGNPQVTSTTERSQATTWTEPTELTGAEGVIDCNSITVHKGKLYAVDQEGKLYSSTEKEKGMVWTKVADAQLQRLLGSDGLNLYGYDGTEILGTQNMNTWIGAGQADLSMLPSTSTYSYYYTSKTNADLTTAMMGGISEGNTAYGVSWYKMTSAVNEYNQPWSYIQVSGDNTHGLPHFQELSTIYYGGNLYTMGRRALSDGTFKFDGFYCSTDNGIAWHLQSEKWLLPTDLNANAGPASVVLIGETLYLVQSGGAVWRGAIK